jgi:hypothetical protein
MPCQWYVRGGGEGNRRILIGQSVPPTPFGMPFGRHKLSHLYNVAQNGMYFIDTSQYRLLFGFFLLYTDRVPFELLDSAALL